MASPLSDSAVLLMAGIVLVLIGIGIIVVAILLSAFKNASSSGAEGGAVIIIGPIPIVLASSVKSAKILLVLALLLTLALLLLMLLPLLLRAKLIGT